MPGQKVITTTTIHHYHYHHYHQHYHPWCWLTSSLIRGIALKAVEFPVAAEMSWDAHEQRTAILFVLISQRIIVKILPEPHNCNCDHWSWKWIILHLLQPRPVMSSAQNRLCWHKTHCRLSHSSEWENNNHGYNWDDHVDVDDGGEDDGEGYHDNDFLCMVVIVWDSDMHSWY